MIPDRVLRFLQWAALVLAAVNALLWATGGGVHFAWAALAGVVSFVAFAVARWAGRGAGGGEPPC